MRKAGGTVFWIIVALAGAWAYKTLAFYRGESLNSAYILIAALCSYAIGYRFYSKWIAARVMALNDRRATPCEVHDDGKDFVRTNKWIVFGHHFAAISGPGPLVGPVLAAQFGYLPGTLWILIGVTLGGAVQDFVILFVSMRRDGKSLAQMVREELSTAAGVVGLVALLAIIVILLAVLALVVVKALADSPWGIFTVGATIPIAMLMGGYLRFVRVGKVMEASVFGIIGLLLAVWGGRYVHGNTALSNAFSLNESAVAWSIIAYGLAASILPVWLLLAPRDYLSTFMKLGTIAALVLGVFLVLPALKMPAITPFHNGTGLVVAGKIFPFCFITIACGAISGFHTLIASGTTPKLITRESYARPVGYGAMCLESLVAIMALIAACTLDPGIYLSMNVKGEPAAVVQKVTAAGFHVTAADMSDLAQTMGEKTLFSRTAGAATLAVGMAKIFSNLTAGRWLDLWYHFAIMFEALFILTTLDAGTRVGRYVLQEMLGDVWKPLGDTRKLGANVLASVLMVAGWGYFLIQGVRDPLGGINSLWPLFGIANQLLAAIALCLATTIILKMQLRPETGVDSSTGPAAGISSGPGRRPALSLITMVPLAWLLAVTMTAGVQKILHHDPTIGFLAQANALLNKRPALEQAVAAARAAGDQAAIGAAEKALRTNHVLRANSLLDATVAGIFLVLVGAIVLLSVREWLLLLGRRKIAVLRETQPVWLPEFAANESRPLHAGGLVALALALAREWSGESHLDRAAGQACCISESAHCATDTQVNSASAAAAQIPSKQKIYMDTLEKRFSGVRRCC
jgi:carbon starvation protein